METNTKAPLWFWGLALTAGLILLWPFTQALYLPLIDLPNHIARHSIMAEAPGGPLGDYFTTRFVLVPNSAVDLLWRMLGYPGDAITFSHRVMAFTALNFFVSGLVLARVIHGRWTGWSLAGGLLVFHVTFLYGFQNYSFSLPFALYAFALYLVAEDWRLSRRLAAFALIAAVLFLMHFFAFGVLAAMAFGREAQKLWENPGRRTLLSGLAMAVPFVLPLQWLAFDMLTGPENPAGTLSAMGSLTDRLYRLATPIYAYASDLAPRMNLAGIVLIIALYAALATLLFRTRISLALAPKMRGPVLVLLALVFLAPEWLSGVALIGIRFTFVFLLVAVVSSRAPRMSPRSAVLGLTVILAALGLRSAMVGQWFNAHDQEVQDLVALIDTHVEPGDRILPVRGPGQFNMPRHRHGQAYAVPVAGAFIPTLFQGVHAVQLRPEWTDHATPLMHANPTCAVFPNAPLEWVPSEGEFCWVEDYMTDWPAKFTKVISMEPIMDSYLDGSDLVRVGALGRFEVFEIAP